MMKKTGKIACVRVSIRESLELSARGDTPLVYLSVTQPTVLCEEYQDIQTGESVWSPVEVITDKVEIRRI